MIDLVRPAPLSDLAAMMAAQGAPASMRKWVRNGIGLAIRHIERGRSWAALEDGRAIACFGVMPVGGDAWEAWFVVDPERARPRMLQVTRLAQLTLRAIAEDGVTIRARVAIGWEPGARIAAAVGMKRAGEALGYELWETR